MAHRQDQLGAGTLIVEQAFKVRAQAETLGAARTVVDGEGPVLAFDAGGSSRNVTLPARAAANDGIWMLVHNISTAGENLTVKNSAATTLVTVPSSGVALVFASVADETPGTREWKAALIGGEDMAIADALTVTGIATLNSTLIVAKQASFTSNIVAASTLDAQTVFSAKTPTLGKATSDVVGFFGGTGSSQRASSNQASTNAAVSASFGATQLAILQEIMNTLTTMSAWKGAA